MNCADIRKYINDDNADLKAIRDHLRTCESCRMEFGEDLDFEFALKELGAEAGTIDIAGNIQALVSTSKTVQSKYIRWKSLIWITAGMLSALLLYIGLPNLISWGKELVSTSDNLLPMLKNLNLGGLESRVQGIRTVENVKIAAAIVGSVLFLISLYLWREFKQIVR